MELQRLTRSGTAFVELGRQRAFFRQSVEDRGWAVTLGGVGRFVRDQALHRRTTRRRETETFTVGGATLRYELGRYNTAWLNERSVEVPLALHALRGVDPSGVLEIGNVLAHYGFTGHTVLDKYENIPGVVNEDVLDYRPGRTFAAVVAVSTLEHVGFDEPTKDPGASAAAWQAMRSLTDPDGFTLATVPLGYNPGLDESVASGVFAADTLLAMRRTSKDNDWTETSVGEALTAAYGRPYPNGNAVLVALDGAGRDRARL